MKRKKEEEEEELSRRRSNPVTRLSPSFPAAYCLPCRLSTLFHSYKANTNSYQTEDKKIIGKYKSYLKSQLEVRADGANTSVLFIGFCAIFFLQWPRKYCFFCTYLWKLTEIWMNRHICKCKCKYNYKLS